MLDAYTRRNGGKIPVLQPWVRCHYNVSRHASRRVLFLNSPDRIPADLSGSIFNFIYTLARMAERTSMR